MSSTSSKRKKKPTVVSHARLVASGKAPKKSKTKHPVKAAWEIFTACKTRLGESFTRKVAIDSALAGGIAYYTARTQYQEWKQAGDRDRAKHQPNNMNTTVKSDWNIIVYDEAGRVVVQKIEKNLDAPAAEIAAKAINEAHCGESYVCKRR